MTSIPQCRVLSSRNVRRAVVLRLSFPVIIFLLAYILSSLTHYETYPRRVWSTMRPIRLDGTGERERREGRQKVFIFIGWAALAYPCPYRLLPSSNPLPGCPQSFSFPLRFSSTPSRSMDFFFINFVYTVPSLPHPSHIISPFAYFSRTCYAFACSLRCRLCRHLLNIPDETILYCLL